MADTLSYINEQKTKIKEHLEGVLDFLDKVPTDNAALSLEILQLSAILVAGLQTCDEAIKAIADNNEKLKKTCLVELDMLRELLSESIKNAQAQGMVH